MKIQQKYRVTFLIMFLISASFSMQAAVVFQDEAPVSLEKQELLKPIQIFKKDVFKKQIFKNKKSKSHSNYEKSIRNGAIFSFAVGLFSLFLLIVGLAMLSASGGGLVLLLAAIAAIVGDIFSIRTLRRIRNSDDAEDYHSSKILAIFGLVLSLLTGLIPLATLILVLLLA